MKKGHAIMVGVLWILIAGLLILPGCVSISDAVRGLLSQVGLGPDADVRREVICGPETGPRVPPDSLPVYKPGIRVARDLAYDRPSRVKSKFTSVDFYLPEKGACRPIVVFIHGGGWVGGDKSYVNTKPEAFVRAGFVFVSVNYRLSPAVSHPGHVKDVAKAIAFIQKNAVKYGGDPTEIYLIGHSAGAHLAALAATNDSLLAENGLPLTAIRGVVLLDGAGYDMNLQMTMTGGPQFDIVYNMAFGRDPKRWRDASPIQYVAPNKGIPPFLMFHLGPGQATGVQAKRFAEALEKAGVPVEIHHARGCNHSSLNARIGDAGDEPTRIMWNFIHRLRW